MVAFAGRTERIARVHHFGLRDSVRPGGPEYDYPARPLLGISDDFTKRLQDRLLSHIAGG
ncbi:Phage virion morphogenesis family protein [compost metagenome]